MPDSRIENMYKEVQDSSCRGSGGVPQFSKSPKIGGYRGLKSASALPAGASNDFVGYEVLIDFMKKHKLQKLEGDIIEIGAFLGGGTAKLGRFAQKYGKKVYAVDIFDPSSDKTPDKSGVRMCDIYQAFLQGRSQLEVYQDTIRNFKNIITIDKDSKRVKFSKGQKFIFGFIDGNHQPDYVRNDFYLIWRHLVAGGSVGFHDYHFDLPEVTKTIGGLIRRHKGEISDVHEIEQKHIVILTKKKMSKQNKSKLEVLQVETTNYCNARCIFCAYDQIKKHGTMSDKLYAKILKDAQKLDPPPKTFIPMLTGEPFLDPHMIDHIEEARAALPKTEIHLYTNGSKLTEKTIKKLAEVPKFHINISANGASVETRKRLTGLGDYEYVAHMIDFMDLLRISHSVSLVQHPSITKEEEAAFHRRWSETTSSSSCRSPYLFQHLNFAGLTYKKDKTHFTCCLHATSHMTVLWDGRVNLCCMDPLGRKIFGDLNHQTVSEVWLSEERQRYAAMHKEGRGTELEVCRDCNIVCF